MGMVMARLEGKATEEGGSELLVWAPAYLGTAVSGQSLIDFIDVGSHRFKTSIESVKALLLNLLKGLLGFLCSLSCCLKLCQREEQMIPQCPGLCQG